MKVVLVTGYRRWANEGAVFTSLDREGPDLIVEGGGDGADAIARKWSWKNKVPCLTWPARWHAHGRSAGPRRNHEMIKFLLRMATPVSSSNGSTVRHDDVLVVAFPAPESTGTVDCMRQARQHGIRVLDETIPCSNCGDPLDRKPDTLVEVLGDAPRCRECFGGAT